MEHPEQAIKYIQKCIIFILSNGTLLDQAKMHYLYAKCLHLLDKANSKRAVVTLIVSDRRMDCYHLRHADLH